MNPRALIFALTAALAFVAPAAASAQQDVRGGVIAQTNGSSFTLRNGVTIFMHQGTVINPTGAQLAPGQAVTIYGSYDGDRRFNADEVDIRGTAADATVTTPIRTGYYDVNGVWHEGSPTGAYVRGYYDANGMFHPATTPPASVSGYYDVNGEFHVGPRTSRGWYDINGVWHPGNPDGYVLGPDGLWHQR